jgi:RNA polymerase sigma factor (sigma-70 family)
MTCSAYHPAPSVQAWLTASQRHLPLAEGTVIELSRRIQRWQSHPDGPAKAPAPLRRRGLRARDRLVCHNLRLVGHVWGRHRQSLPIHEEMTADALQEAAMSLLRAAEKYDPSRGYRFSTYASFWVRKGFSEIEKHQKRLIRFPAEKASVVLKAQRLSDEQEALTGVAPSLEWLAPRCSLHGKPLRAETLATLLLQWEQTQTGTLENRQDDDGPDSQRLTMASMRQSKEQELADDPHWEKLPKLLDMLTSAQRQVIEGLYLQQPPLSRQELQRRLRLTALELRELEQGALRRMREGVG